MNRREFFRLAAFAASLPGCARLSGAPGGKPKKVIVLGAGLAGMTAGYELAQAGHDVTILEGSARAGGRVNTLRQTFDDDLYAEAGAHFVTHNHYLVFKYAALFGISVGPATPLFEARLFYVRGQRLLVNWGPRISSPLDLTPEERKLGLHGMWNKYVRQALSAFAGVSTLHGLHDSSFAELDRLSFAEFLRSRGASPGAVALLRVGGPDLIGEGIESYSALQILHGLALTQAERPRYLINGGSEMLPQGFAARLGARIRYRSPVIRIEPGAHSASVVIGHDGHYERLTAEHIVCALPFSVLKRIEVSPSFSAEKRRVIEELRYTSVARMFLQFAERTWRREHLYIGAATDLPIKWVSEHTVNQPGRRGILEAQATGADARRLGAMPEAERLAFALSQLERIFPGVRQAYERGVSKCWDEDPWARGAFAYFRPGQMLSFLPHLARPEGCIHFAGEHTSAWAGWMEGALESGLRAVREVAGTA